MTARLVVTRRILLKDMGKAGLAIMVLGAAACSGSPDGAVDSSGPREDPTSTTGTTVGATTTTGVSASSDPSPDSGWHRVSLDFVSAYILYRSGSAIIVDTGVDGSSLSIESGLSEVGLGWGDVEGLIVTHKHPDHQGSVPGVLAATPAGTPWYAGAGDIEAINAPHPGLVAEDGDRIAHLEIVATPGHTPGHLSVLDPASGALVTGDALNGRDGGVAGPNPGFTEDLDLANASVRRLAQYEFDIALFGHGEPLLEGASRAVADLAAGL